MSKLPQNGSLVFTQAAAGDHGEYQCFAENKYGTASSNVIRIEEANSQIHPFPDKEDLTITVSLGHPLKIECNPSKLNQKRVGYGWFKVTSDGRRRGIRRAPNSIIDPDGNLCFSQVLHSDSIDELGKPIYYECEAMIRSERREYFTETGRRHYLNLEETTLPGSQLSISPVKQFVSPEHNVVQFGRLMELACIYGGTPEPEIVWKKDDRRISLDHHFSTPENGRLLLIHVAYQDINDTGEYTCEVSNGDSHKMNVEVQAILKFTTEPQTVNVVAGDNVIFICEAVGHTTPTISWIINGRPIEQAPANPRRTINPNSIVISNVNLSDSGNYGCKAENEQGDIYKEAQLIFQ